MPRENEVKVVPVAASPTREPNAPCAVLATNDEGVTR